MEISKQIKLIQSFIDLVKNNKVLFVEIRADTVKTNDIIMSQYTLYHVNTIVKNNITNRIIYFDKDHNTNIDVSNHDKIPVLYINHKPISQLLVEINNQFNVQQNEKIIDTKLLMNFLDYFRSALLIENSVNSTFVQVNDIVIYNYQLYVVTDIQSNKIITVSSDNDSKESNLQGMELILFNGNQSLAQIVNSSIENTFFNELQDKLERIK